jgi:Spy/CpxP family protein refolding chaperone
MKNLRIKTFILGCFIISCLTVQALGQPTGMRPGQGMGMRHWREERRCWAASELNLSAEQAKAIDALNQAYFQEARRYRIELFTKRLELKEYLTNPAVKAETIQAKDSEIVQLQSEMEEKTIQYLIKVKTVLTPEQLKAWCPEQEFPTLQHRMEISFPPVPRVPRVPRASFPYEDPKKE